MEECNNRYDNILKIRINKSMSDEIINLMILFQYENVSEFVREALNEKIIKLKEKVGELATNEEYYEN